MSGALILGGTGTFGRLVAAELASRGASVTISSRWLERAQAIGRALDPPQRAVALDLARPDSYRSALQGHSVAVHCAGPFHGQDAGLLVACVDAGCHYVDLAEDRVYAALVRSKGDAFRARGLWAVSGCSSLPGLSGALGLLAQEALNAPAERARVTLFIGNANRKGRAAVRTLVAGLGQPIAAPQGTVRGFRDPERVALPGPFGTRVVYNFESPEYDLFPDLLGVQAVSVKVGFELRLATAAIAALAALPVRYGAVLGDMLEFLARPLRFLGHSGGVVRTELFCADGTVQSAAIWSPTEGQRMAALPCALVALSLCRDPRPGGGAATAYEYLGAHELLDWVAAAGFRLTGK